MRSELNRKQSFGEQCNEYPFPHEAERLVLPVGFWMAAVRLGAARRLVHAEACVALALRSNCATPTRLALGLSTPNAKVSGNDE